VDEATILYRFERVLPVRTQRFLPAFIPTSEQRILAAKAKAVALAGDHGEIHAVCGSGKTEILYEAILAVLERGGRVCIAIPRRDIVAELAARLAPIFPDAAVKPLHRDAKDDDESRLLVATVHQLVNYHQEFDFLVLDEADAFPYRGDALLHRLVAKARKPDAAFIEMTATPPGDRRDHWFLPARFHRHPLDVPVIAYSFGLREDILRGRIPQEILVWIRPGGIVRRALLFVPTVAYGQALQAALEKAGIRALSVSSRDASASLRIRSFRDGRSDLLVTTTLLERGVTFRGIDVAVLSAEDDIFAKNVLVQIAGRVGRFAEQPSGSVRFFAETASAAMVRAIAAIRSANALARKKGLVDDDL
jgi:competence protein ComFA